jgi:hypothetical protein
MELVQTGSYGKAPRVICQILTGLSVTFLPTQSFAELPEGYTGTRAIGMGDAFTAVANDETSFFTNPAGIARVRKARSRNKVHIAKFPNGTLGMNSGAKNLYTIIKGASGTAVSDAIADSDVLSDKPFYVRGAAFPTTDFELSKNQPAAFGLLGNSISKIYIDKDTPTDARISSVTDMGGAVGISFTNFANRLNMGLSVRPTYRYAYEDTVPVDSLKNSKGLATRMKKSANSGFGVGVDFGTMFTLADFWFPTIGMSILNLPTGCQSDYLNPYTETRQSICGTKYSSATGNPDALSNVDPTDLRLGVSISPRLALNYGFRLAADVHNLYLQSGTSYYGLPGVDAAKLLHAGLEFFTGNPLEQHLFSLRVGANQGFVTYGASLNLAWLNVDFASYGVDVSNTVSRIEDRRYLGTLGFSF